MEGVDIKTDKEKERSILNSFMETPRKYELNTRQAQLYALSKNLSNVFT